MLSQPGKAFARIIKPSSASVIDSQQGEIAVGEFAKTD
jgi:hypothetical protein